MTHIIAEPCIGVKDTACVDVCPVDCIYGKEEDWEMLYIHPGGVHRLRPLRRRLPGRGDLPHGRGARQVEGVHRQELRALRPHPSVT